MIKSSRRKESSLAKQPIFANKFIQPLIRSRAVAHNYLLSSLHSLPNLIQAGNRQYRKTLILSFLGYIVLVFSILFYRGFLAYWGGFVFAMIP